MFYWCLVALIFVFVIASNYTPSRKSLCDLSFGHVVFFITTENATIGMSSWWFRVRCLNLFVVIGSLGLSSSLSEFWACYIAVTSILRRATFCNLTLLRSSHQKLFKQQVLVGGVEKQIRGLC
jgi:hypothetical protein